MSVEEPASTERATEYVRLCPVCNERYTYSESSTQMLERYADDSVGFPGDPRRIPERPARKMIPGAITTTYSPCGHEVTS